MNQKELNEIRRRFKLDKNSISRIYGCYVNSSREIIAYIDESMGLMSQEEQEMYLGLLKKALSGGLGRNLINIEFSTAQVAGSDEHRLLQQPSQRRRADALAQAGHHAAGHKNVLHPAISHFQKYAPILRSAKSDVNGSIRQYFA